MTTKKLNWMESGYDEMEDTFAFHKRVLAVDDDHLCHVANLPDSMSVQDGLNDYASGYDAGDYKGEIVINWHLYEGGQETRSGRWTLPTSSP